MKRVLLALALLLAAAGCADPAKQIAAEPEPVSQARIGLVEWEITSSAAALTAGPITLQVTNAGATAHDIRVSGDDTDARVPLLAPGETARVALDLTGERELVLWCTVPGHRREGMQRILAVGE